MSRSYRKTPIAGNTKAESEKQDKRLANRQFRAALRRASTDEDALIPLKREVTSLWKFNKDGKQYLGSHPPAEWMRK